jgi:hypothetical protein
VKRVASFEFLLIKRAQYPPPPVAIVLVDGVIAPNTPSV